jgi:hypothetical protein
VDNVRHKQIIGVIMEELELYVYPEGKTNYQIINENSEKTTITLEKWVADILQLELSNVHESLQEAYNQLALNHPNLTRRKKGDYLRRVAELKANKYQKTKKQVLGWNDDELLQSL